MEEACRFCNRGKTSRRKEAPSSFLPTCFRRSCSVAKSCMTVTRGLYCSTSGSSVLHCLPEFAQIHVHCWVMLFNHLILCHPLLFAFSFSQHQNLFQWVGSSHQVAKYWSFSINISPSNGYSGLIFFRIDWFDLLEVQGTVKSLLWHLYWLAFIWGSGRAGHGNGLLLSWCEKRLACA